jgi:hypothetical protein
MDFGFLIFIKVFDFWHRGNVDNVELRVGLQGIGQGIE